MKIKKLEKKALEALADLVGKNNKNKNVRLDTAVSILNLMLTEKEDRIKKKENKLGY